MLGYFKPFTSELSHELRKEYKTLYCSLCKNIYKRYSLKATICNRYDITFILLCLNHINGIQFETIIREPCALFPIKRINTYKIQNSNQIADFSVLILYMFYIDKLKDGEGKFKNYLLYRYFKSDFAKLKLYITSNGLEEYLYKINSVFENEIKTSDINNKINYFATFIFEMSKDFLCYKEIDFLDSKFFQSILTIMYYLDALEDYHIDIKNNQYNILHKIDSEQIDSFKLAEYVILKELKNIKQICKCQDNLILKNILDIAIVRKMLILQQRRKIA